MEIIIAIIILILAVLLIIKYEKIDRALFSSFRNDDSYEVFGKGTIMASAVCGAIMTISVVVKKTFNLDWNVEAAVILGISLLIVVIAASIYESFVKMPTMGSAIGKAFFLLFTSIVGALVGMVGSLIIIGLLMIYLVLMILGGALSSSGSSSSSSSSNSYDPDQDYDAKTTDENGYERKLKETWGGYVDDKGDRWKSTGYNQVTRDDD